MKRIALIFALVLAAACSRQASMEQLAARVFDVAGRQVQILAAALASTQVPRTLNPDGSLSVQLQWRLDKAPTPVIPASTTSPWRNAPR